MKNKQLELIADTLIKAGDACFVLFAAAPAAKLVRGDVFTSIDYILAAVGVAVTFVLYIYAFIIKGEID